MIFSRSEAAARKGQFLFALIAGISFFIGTIGSAAAGYGPVREGGGTWGSILEMSAELLGPTVRFTVRKKDGLPFNSESSVSIRTGSYSGPLAASEIVQLGSSSARLSVRLDNIRQGQDCYAYLFNSYGYAWVGPLKIAGAEAAELPQQIYMPVQEEQDVARFSAYENSVGLERPRLDRVPAAAVVGEELLVAVTTGRCRDWMQLQCFAEDENQQHSNYYDSDRLTSDRTVMIPFTFTKPGTQTIFCKARSRCCSSPWASRTIRVAERPNRAPSPPQISSNPAEVRVNVPAYIPVLSGADPDGDQVKVKCWTSDASREQSISGWLNEQRSVDAVFTFVSPGSKTISCITVDRNKAKSLVAERTITVLAEPVPLAGRSSSQAGTKINISVMTNADGTADSRVSVESSRSEECEPFCGGEISYDKPYLPSDVGPADGQTVYEEGGGYIIPAP
ncbi:hypothetical protein [Candidatus Electronema sp. JM]|uniref:hypothetical protein n=1 Tax=Candidatus Electronema sp. JM TaxID=3401571 RepID=UPI003AA99C56